MLVGRNSPVFPSNERIPYSWTPVSNNVFTRNLRKSDLGGVIFGCKHNTIKECLFKQLFGLPTQHFSYVNRIDQGLPLFLFNYSDRKLHGIFEAESPGQMNINPYGWTACGSKRTLYPAQVRIRIRMQCQPLGEEQFRPVISQNYYTNNHFWFELDHAQTSGLISLFSSSPIIVSTSLPRNTALWNTLFQALSIPDKRQDSNDFKPPASKENVSHSDQSKELGSLGTALCFIRQSQQPAASVTLSKFILENSMQCDSSGVASCLDGGIKPLPAPEVDFSSSEQSTIEFRYSDVSHCLDGEQPPSASEADFVYSDQSNTEWEVSGVSPCLNEENQPQPSLEIDTANENRPNLEQRCSGTATCLNGVSKPSPASEEKVGHSSQSSTQLGSSSVTPYLDGERLSSPASGMESHLDEETLEKDEEERVYQILKQLALKREHSKENAENVPFVTKDMHCENHDKIFISSSDQPIIAKLMQELKELKVFQMEQILSTNSLEKKLAMVTREDLGAELAMNEVPLLQAEIVKMSRSMGNAIILASDMLESLIFYQTPTGAVSDIAIAVGEEADAVEFSGETANGK